MAQSVNKILKILFDIKPVDDLGRVDLQKIYRIQPVVNLAKSQEPRAKSQNDEKFFFGTWDESVGVRDLALVDGKKANKKAPTDAASNKLVNSVGAARNASPDSHLNYSLSQPRLKSSVFVDNQKSRHSETIGSVEDRGFAPLDSQVTNRGWHYASPTAASSYQVNGKKQNYVVELEKYLNENLNIKRELRNIGGKTVLKKKIGKPRYRPIFAKQTSGSPTSQVGATCDAPDIQTSKDGSQLILSRINQRVVPAEELFAGEPRRIDPISLGILPEAKPVSASPEIENWARYAKAQSARHKAQKVFGKFTKPDIVRVLNFIRPTPKHLLAAAVVGFSVLIFTSLGQYGIDIKDEIVKESSSAVASLEQANESLKVFDFTAASNNFAQAYGEFSKAGENLNFMGANITSLFADLPGAGKLRSAKNLVEAGKLIAEAGKSMSAAVGSLAQTGSIFKLTTPDQTADAVGTEQASDAQNILSSLKKSLTFSSRNLSKASALLSDVSSDVLPEDKRESFTAFQSQLPKFEKLVSDAVDYTDFLEGFVGSKGTKKYLILFQNSSELRPTGGFPGTYAVMTFKDGRLRGILVDDVYNLDGQLKENIIPPAPLQHITPTWGMRDSNWFIDFSVSAQKAMEFFKKEAGYEVNGVITVSPKTISEILKVVGPIEMPEYGFTVNSDNFLSTIQEEVEYGDNRTQPKKVVVDMAPRLLEKIYSADTAKWLDIFNVFVAGLEQKDLIMYFKDLGLESFVAENEFGGLVKSTDSDYLMVTLSNIKGSKTDEVINNSIKVVTRFEKDKAVHKLELTRKHSGGATEFGFYNKRNPAYVRVLVPEGAELISISGNSNPEFRPLISYSGGDFKRDEDLFKLESSFHLDGGNDVVTYEESGKTGFAFWLVTDPGQTKTVELQYAVPFESGKDSYDIYVQKQPGLEVDNFEFQVGDAYIYNGEFDKDMELRFKIDN